MRKILFVCHGNICRSAMAEFMMKDLVRKAGMADDFYIESAAVSREEIGNDMYPPAKACLREHGIPFTRHEARQVRKKDYDIFDEIYVMDPSNQKLIRRIIERNPEHKIHLLLDGRGIADPWYTGDFEKTYQDLEYGLNQILDHPKTE